MFEAENDVQGFVREIFLSFQGEGFRIGEPCVFIRLSDCNLSCPWCDTEHERKPDFEIELPGLHCRENNPVSSVQLARIIAEKIPEGITVSLTGGEPLLQADFCSSLCSMLNRPVLLETNGTLPDILSPVAEFFDYISADVKLDPASTWLERAELHEEFLNIIAHTGKGCAKVIVGERTDRTIFAEALSMISSKKVPMVIQPVTAADGTIKGDDMEAARSLALMAAAVHAPVCLIPQMHRLIGIR